MLVAAFNGAVDKCESATDWCEGYGLHSSPINIRMI